MLYTISYFLVLAVLVIWPIGDWAMEAFAETPTAATGVLPVDTQSTEFVTLTEWVEQWEGPNLAVAMNTSAETVLSWGPAAFQNAVNWLSPFISLRSGIDFAVMVFGGLLLYALSALHRKPRNRRSV